MKIGIIIPYYGEFPSYFDLVLKSMKNQQNYYFIFLLIEKLKILTDCHLT
ncbi:hypothetical protein CaldiYA01_03220 [Caldicellulosiruptor diazotrophicus]|uniref:Uncharacterized protein n=1 Tax=Caldicellulosiruptor diazotrophicus TaxID=2806205 RepID=A0ABM7NJT8_9FIRM|nr:hypothetical protein CaldiYA01_03220 [Caldicellulosiruptor diazotrophicus]